MKELGPVNFILLHDNSEHAINRAQELMPYGRKMLAQVQAMYGPDADFAALTHNLPDGSRVTVETIGRVDGVRQYRATIRTKAGGEKDATQPWPYLWVGARWMYEEIGGHPLQASDPNEVCTLYENSLGVEVFEPFPENDEPILGPSDQGHVTTWNYQEDDFPRRDYWASSPAYMEGRHNGNPGVWTWSSSYYGNTDFAEHPANAENPLIPGVSPLWITYTDRFLYQTNWVIPPMFDQQYNIGEGIKWTTGYLLYAAATDASGEIVEDRFTYLEPPQYVGQLAGALTWAPHDPTDPRNLNTPYPYSVVTVLDPFEGWGQLPDGGRNFPTDRRPNRAWRDFYAAGAVHGVTAYGLSQVRSGDYVIKVFAKEEKCSWMSRSRERPCVIPPIELKVMVGKAPFTSTRKYRVQLNDVGDLAFECFAYGRDLCWSGLGFDNSCCGWDRWVNIKAANYWSDAVVVDVNAGSQGLASELGKPAWPVTKTPAFEDDRVGPGPTLAYCGWAHQRLILVGQMPYISYWLEVDEEGSSDPELHPDDGMPQAVAKIIHEYHRLILGARSNTESGAGIWSYGSCFPGPPENCIDFRREVADRFRAVNPTLGAFALIWDPHEPNGEFEVIPTPDLSMQNVDPSCGGTGLDGCKNWPDWMKTYICEAYEKGWNTAWYSLGQSGNLAFHSGSARTECGSYPVVKPGQCCQLPPDGDGTECGGGDPYGWRP